MTQDQVQIFAILFAAIVMFLWGRWRHDMVALGALLACVFAGLVSSEAAFAGFGHPAVITVAAVLVLSRGLQSTGALDTVAQRLLGAASSPSLTIAILTLTGAVLSAFMNNVGAMALLMPVAIQFADKHELPPGRILMPLAFGTILGGMTTLIGTPPNLIVSGFRKETDAGSFGMFDFSPVGIAVALAGVAFISLIGWRLVPARPKSGAESFDTGTYLTEVNVTEDSKAAGKRLREVDEILAEADAQVIGMVRNEFRVSAPNLGRTVRAGDILVIEAEPESLSNALSSLGLKLKEDGRESDKEEADVSKSADRDTSSQDETEEEQDRDSRDIELQEVVVRPDSALIGRTAATVHLRTRYGLNLLAISRQGRHTIRRLRSTSVRAGDVLLLQGDIDSLGLFVTEFSCVPLASRAIRIPDKRRAGIAVGHDCRDCRRSVRSCAGGGFVYGGHAGVHGVSRTAGKEYLRCHRLVCHRIAGRVDSGCRRGGFDRRGRPPCKMVARRRCDGQPDRVARAYPGSHHDALGFHEQCRNGCAHVPHRHQRRVLSRHEYGHVSHGGCGWRIVRIPDADRAPEQHAHSRAGRFPFRGLLATRVADGSACRAGCRADAVVCMASLKSLFATPL